MEEDAESYKNSDSIISLKHVKDILRDNLSYNFAVMNVETLEILAIEAEKTNSSTD